MCNQCDSPLEKQFHEAWDAVSSTALQPQYEIGQYRADFCYRCIGQYKILIEIDSKQYHTSKEQIEHDRQRDYDLRVLGFHIIRLSGLDVYHHPLSAVRVTQEYIASYAAGFLMAAEMLEGGETHLYLFRQAQQVFSF